MARTTHCTVILLISVLVFVVSCGETGVMFPSSAEDTEIEILAIRNGEILAPADSVSVDVINETEETILDRMTIELNDRDGESIFVQELGSEEIGELPLPMMLPEDLATGRYEMIITLYEGEEIRAQHEASFYVTAESYAVTGITPYPQVFYPGGEGLLIADLDIPENAEPFLRWRSSGEVVAEGVLSEGTNEIVIDIPDREGVFSVQLELFPVGDELPPYEILSSIALEAQFFVSSDQSPDLHELGEEDEYVSLFHFRGETRDWGREAPDDAPNAGRVGDPELELGSQTLGYEIEPGEGFVIRRSILPIGEEGLKSFSLSVRFVYRRHGTLFTVADDYGTELVTLRITEENIPKLVIGESEAMTAGVSVEPDVSDELTVSVIREEESLRLLWFISGLLVAENRVDFVPIEWPETMTTHIGGSGGFAGLIDEFGVYSSAAADGEEVDTGVYARAMRLEYGSDLLYAEGFDGTSVPPEIAVVDPDSETEPNVSVDSAYVERGALVVQPGMKATLPLIPIGFDTVRIDLGMLKSLDGVSAIFAVTGAVSEVELVSYQTSVGYVKGDTLLAPPVEDQSLRIDLRRQNGSFGLISTDQIFELGSVEDEDASLKVTIENEGDSDALLVDKMLIVKNRVSTNDRR